MRCFIFLLFFPFVLCGQTADELYSQAEIFFGVEQYDASIKKLKEAIELNPSNEAAYELLIDNYYAQGKYKEVFETYRSVIYLFPKNVSFYNDRAALLNDFQEFELALEDYDKALNNAEKYQPEARVLVLSNRGGTKAKVRDYEGAYADLKRAYDIDSLNISVLNNLGTICTEIDRPEETFIYLEKILEIEPDFIPALINIGFKYQEMEEYEASLKYFDRVVALQTNEPYALSNRSYSRLKTGDLKGALADVNKSIELMPLNAYAYRNRALIHLAMKKHKKACKDFEMALENKFTRSYGEEVLELQREHCK